MEATEIYRSINFSSFFDVKNLFHDISIMVKA
jgi:hypothetical protein